MGELALRPAVVDGVATHSSLDEVPYRWSPLLGSRLTWTPASYEEIAASIAWHKLPWWRRLGGR